MKYFLLSISVYFYLVCNVACLNISISSHVKAKKTTSVHWQKNQTSNFEFDLQFVQDGRVLGVAASIKAEKEAGDVDVIFPSKGKFNLKAVKGNQLLTLSDEIDVKDARSSPSPSTNSGTGPQSPSTNSHSKTPAIVGGVIGGLIALSLLVILLIFLRRRRETIRKCPTFNKDLMVQHRVAQPPSIWEPGSSIFGSRKGSNRGSHARAAGRRNSVLGDEVSARNAGVGDGNVERGFGYGFGPGPAGADTGYVFAQGRAALGTGHIVPSPKGPRPSMKQANSPRLQPPLQSMSQYQYPSQSPSRLQVSYAEQQVQKWVETQAQVEPPSRSQLTSPPPTQFAPQQRQL